MISSQNLINELGIIYFMEAASGKKISYKYKKDLTSADIKKHLQENSSLIIQGEFTKSNISELTMYSDSLKSSFLNNLGKLSQILNPKYTETPLKQIKYKESTPITITVKEYMDYARFFLDSNFALAIDTRNICSAILNKVSTPKLIKIAVSLDTSLDKNSSLENIFSIFWLNTHFKMNMKEIQKLDEDENIYYYILNCYDFFYNQKNKRKKIKASLPISLVEKILIDRGLDENQIIKMKKNSGVHYNLITALMFEITDKQIDEINSIEKPRFSLTDFKKMGLAI